jgi:O-antigen ligase
MSVPIRSALLWLAACYIVLMPTTAAKPIRVVLWIAGVMLAVAAVARALRQREPVASLPGRAVIGCLVFWMLWSTASVLWSPRPAFTLEELRNEVLNNAILIAIFYYVAEDDHAIRTLVAATIGGFALHAVLMLGLASHTGDHDTFRWHFGNGWVATWLALTAPFLALPLFARPLGFRGGPKSILVALALFALLMAAAAATENRMIWIAFAAQAMVLSAFAIRRWPGRAAQRFGKLAVIALLGASFLAAGFVWTLHERVPKTAPESESVASTLRNDPRLDLWSRSMESIAERPWIGHGFGKGITGEEMVRDLGNPLLWHPHNVFLSQWQQTGFIGMAALTGLFVALASRFLRFTRSRDDAVALAGAIGLAVLAGFLLKNMTDDFMVRSAAKEFWAYTAMLLGYGAYRERRSRGIPGALPARTNHARDQTAPASGSSAETVQV